MKKIFTFFTSIKLTLILLSCLFIQILLTTLLQTKLGIFHAKELFLTSWFIGIKKSPILQSESFIFIPLFPGGLLISLLLTINLICAQIKYTSLTKKKLGIWLIHSGLLILIIGAGLTHFSAIESQLILKEGESKYYSQDRRNLELAFIKQNKNKDELISIPEKMLKRKKIINQKNIPFSIKIKKTYKNAFVEIQNESQNKNLKGIGEYARIHESKPQYKDNILNYKTIIFEVFSMNNQSQGNHIASLSLDGMQEIIINNTKYLFALRQKQEYNDYKITLKDFQRKTYKKSNKPKRFASVIQVENKKTNENRTVTISMNKPFRYQGKTYYQASFGENDTLSILQVVENKAWLFPYVACIIMSLGLIIHFLKMLYKKGKK